MQFIKRIRTLLIVLFLLSLTGCGSLEDAVEEAKKVYPGDWEVLHAESLQDEVTLVFYIQNNELGVGLFEKNTFGWNWLGSGLGTVMDKPKGLSWRYSDLGSKTKAVYIYYGIIKNPEITKIEVKTTWGEVAQAKITDVDGCRLWYAFISRPQLPSVDADITGYSTKGEIKYLFSQPKQGNS